MQKVLLSIGGPSIMGVAGALTCVKGAGSVKIEMIIALISFGYLQWQFVGGLLAGLGVWYIMGTDNAAAIVITLYIASVQFL